MRVAFAPTRVAAMRAAAPRVMRPVALQSSFMGNTSVTAGLCSSFAGMSLSTAHRTGPAQRQSLVVQAGKKSMGCTLEGTRRKKVRVSGFRARMATPAGRRVIAARRKKGRKRLSPGKYRK